MKATIRKIITGFLCLAFITLSFTSISTQTVFAQVGAMVKEEIASCSTASEWTEAQRQQYEKELDQKDYRFVAPKSFTEDGKKLSRSAASQPYFSKLNPYETSTEWKSMGVHQRVLASEIPETLINQLSTDDLLVTCLNYNMLCNLYFCDTLQEGFDTVAQQYNGLQMLLQRKDSASRLLKLYQSIDLFELHERDQFSSIRMNFLELMLAQDSILQSLSEEESRALVAECYRKAMQITEEQSGHFGVSTTVYLGLRCLYEHDSYVRGIIDASEGLKAFVHGFQLNLNDVSDETVGKLAVHLQKKYLGGVLS